MCSVAVVAVVAVLTVAVCNGPNTDIRYEGLIQHHLADLVIISPIEHTAIEHTNFNKSSPPNE